MLLRSLLAGAAALPILLMVLQAAPAAAQSLPKLSDFQFEAKVNSWISEGETTWSFYNGSPFFGNPTSELKYNDVGTNVVELGGQVNYLKRWFVRGDYGFADIGGGRLIDDDYVSAAGAAAAGTSVSGAHRYSRTFSDVNGNDMWYVNLDGGYKLLNVESKGSLGLFVGYQYWRQSHTARGITQVECTAANPTARGFELGIACNPAGTVSNSNRTVISNTAAWSSLKLGVEGDYRVFSRLNLAGKFAFIPYASLDNKDIHYLRTDLAQNPSFRMTGTGIGINAETTISVLIISQLYFDVGYRFWWMNVLDGQLQSHANTGAVSTVALNEFSSMRQGMTFGVHYQF